MQDGKETQAIRKASETRTTMKRTILAALVLAALRHQRRANGSQDPYRHPEKGEAIMKRSTAWKHALIPFLIWVLAVPAEVLGQETGAATAFGQEELNQMLAPLALYPDSLEVVSADRWVKQNKDLKGDQLNAALDKMKWDLSVKALVPFPEVLAMMSEKLEWTQTLGEAFPAQQAAVMDTIQTLRAKAQAAGNLKTTQEQKVEVKGQAIVIEPASPTTIYVPVYNPTVVYGAWPYPAYPPYAYYPAGAAVAAGVFGFAAGVAVGAAWNNGWGRWNWAGGSMNVNVNRNVNINSARVSHYQNGKWKPGRSQRKRGNPAICRAWRGKCRRWQERFSLQRPESAALRRGQPAGCIAAPISEAWPGRIGRDRAA